MLSFLKIFFIVCHALQTAEQARKKIWEAKENRFNPFLKFQQENQMLRELLIKSQKEKDEENEKNKHIIDELHKKYNEFEMTQITLRQTEAQHHEDVIKTLKNEIKFFVKNMDQVDEKTLNEILSIEETGYFDAAFYLAKYPEVEVMDRHPLDHYCQIGWKKGYDPNVWFSTQSALEMMPDKNRNPLVTYIESGCIFDINTPLQKEQIKAEIISLIHRYDFVKEKFNTDSLEWIDLPIFEEQSFEFVGLDSHYHWQVILRKNHTVNPGQQHVDQWLFQGNNLFFQYRNIFSFKFDFFIQDSVSGYKSYIGRNLKRYRTENYKMLLFK